MQIKVLNLPFHTGMPTRVYSLVNVIVDDGGSKCKRESCTSGYCWSLSDFGLVLLKWHDSSCNVISGAARLQVVK